MLRGLWNLLKVDRPEHHSIDRWKERGVEEERGTFCTWTDQFTTVLMAGRKGGEERKRNFLNMDRSEHGSIDLLKKRRKGGGGGGGVGERKRNFLNMDRLEHHSTDCLKERVGGGGGGGSGEWKRNFLNIDRPELGNIDLLKKKKKGGGGGGGGVRKEEALSEHGQTSVTALIA